MKNLGDLLEAASPLACHGDLAAEIDDIAFDSRLVRPGNLFVALPGRRSDGNVYIQDALRRGAAAVVSQSPEPPPGLDVPYVVVADANLALSRLSAALHDFPARRLGSIGITGTNGKTTTAHMTSAILAAAGIPVGRLSTVDLAVGSSVRRNETNHTTPQAPQVQAALAEMVAAGARYAVVEASSHALVRGRVADCEFDVAVFTNLSAEHLDFHGSLAQYREDKARLFRMLGASADKGLPKFGVVNADDREADYFREASPAPVLTYALDAPADVVGRAWEVLPSGTRFVIAAPSGEVVVHTRLVGRFNLYNWLAASTVAVGLGIGLGAVARAAEGLTGVPGRMQVVDEGQPFLVVVDFAHTPHALEGALTTLRQQVPGRVLAVFGHAGGRDRNNRPALARTAARFSDFFVITSDDPYDEDPQFIVDEVESGLADTDLELGRHYLKLVDRREGIAAALARARPGDAVLIAGRGHELYMPVGEQLVPFDDVAVARGLLAGRPRMDRAAA